MRVEVMQEGAITIAQIAGEIDIANRAQFADEVLGRMADDSTALVVDLTELRYIDSAGMRTLFEIAAALNMREQFFAVAVLEGSPLRSVLKVTRFEDVAAICPTRQDALDLASLERGGSAKDSV